MTGPDPLADCDQVAFDLATNVRLACERWYAARPARGDLQ